MYSDKNFAEWAVKSLCRSNMLVSSSDSALSNIYLFYLKIKVHSNFQNSEQIE